MKILKNALIASALTVAWVPAEAATVHHYIHHVHVVHHYHHHYYAGSVHYYAGGPGYSYPPPGYYPPPGPYQAPGVYAPGYFYATPEEPLGNRGVLGALIDSEWDPPFSGR